MSSHYDICNIEILPPQKPNQPSNRLHTGYIEVDFSKFSTSKLSKSLSVYVPLPQLSRHAIVRRKINITVLDSIRETRTDNQISQINKVDLQKILVLFIIDFVQYKLDLILQARKKFRPQRNDETILADKTCYVWDPDCSHVLLFYYLIRYLKCSNCKHFSTQSLPKSKSTDTTHN